MNAIEIKNLSKHYVGFSIENLNLTLPRGCIMGLVGENGAGKSTTIRMILGLTRPDGGEITVFGQKLSRELKQKIGVVLDEPGYPTCMNAAQIGRMLAGIYQHWEQETYEDYLTKLHIPENKPFKDFSKGMKMKLSLVAALSHGAELLILDDLGTEPSTKTSSSAIYRLINHRVLVNNLPTIISTNLTYRQLEKEYDSAVLSRLLGEFNVKLFRGEDIRMARLKME